MQQFHCRFHCTLFISIHIAGQQEQEMKLISPQLSLDLAPAGVFLHHSPADGSKSKQIQMPLRPLKESLDWLYMNESHTLYFQGQKWDMEVHGAGRIFAIRDILADVIITIDKKDFVILRCCVALACFKHTLEQTLPPRYRFHGNHICH